MQQPTTQMFFLFPNVDNIKVNRIWSKRWMPLTWCPECVKVDIEYKYNYVLVDSIVDIEYKNNY